MRKNEIIAAIDFGTTKVIVLIAEAGEKGLQVIGVGVAESEGMRKGMIINIGKTVESIVRAKKASEHMAGCEISTVVSGIGGSTLTGVNKNGMISTKKGEISRSDVERVIETAMTYPMPLDRTLINVIPQQYTVDDHDGIKDPIGMSGVRLDMDVHLITAASASVENITKCAKRAELKIVDLLANPLASSLAVLEKNEKELGVALVDIGGGTTEISVWINGALVWTSVLGIGGQLITQDIGTGLRTPLACAEEIKVRYGCAKSDLVDPSEMVEVPGVGGREEKVLRRSVLTEIIEPRMEEIFRMVQKELEKTEFYDLLAAGVVITGGTSQMQGIVELGEEVLNLPVRNGGPLNVKGLSNLVSSPSFSTAYGLLVYETMMMDESLPFPMKPVRVKGQSTGFFKKVANFLF
ncbi:MAG: cell division protein FtsA [Deltaproteobacteria bacterium]|nr:cell division protein FtsA [Deltaproteobacteria bacterium]